MDPRQFSYANLSNLSLLEDLYAQFLKDPNSVEVSWRHFFEGMQFASSLPQVSSPQMGSPDLKVFLLIQAFRKYGHLMASFNPIATTLPIEPSELNIENLGFKTEDLEALFPTCGFLKKAEAPLKEIVEALKKTYCGKIGTEYLGMGSPSLEKWVQEQIEPLFPLNIEKQEKIRILHELNKSEIFESFLHTKYVGQKRFSLEGGETMIPLLSAMIQRGSEIGVEEVVLGMSHRGRLNILANILNKSYTQIFHEFEAHYQPDQFEGSGDVKYHKGFAGELKTASGKAVHVTLVANPSHLESVDPVVEGIARAKQELRKNKDLYQTVVPILIHGDTAVAGQGVVYETIQLSRLKGYATGGTVHIIVNNQIGFTTLPQDARSTLYCTEIGRSFSAPIFHVNAEDPEGCVRVAKLAIEIRNLFKCDVFIDLNCYRKYGHNEGDEPTFTQPLEYSLIKSKRSIREIFRDQLIEEKILDEQTALKLETEFKESLQHALESIPQPTDKKVASKENVKISGQKLSDVKTGVPSQILIHLADRFCSVPEELRLHPKIQRLLKDRLEMVHSDPNKASIDWGMGEHLSFASLLNEGIHLRLSGQDVRRGTFSHRHAVWVDQVKEKKYFPLSHLSETQAPFDVYNSPLSEYAVLGFDFGYSTAYANSLVIWEAQFGDFANGAQIIIDQYIASSEQKWNLSSNIVLLLPHGYEGQGPEHSSARIERFLQLAGNDNTRIVNCTTPAQLFHLLRAQAKLSIKKPLIIFSPKMLLRYPACVSSLNAFTTGSFEEILDDPSPPTQPQKILLCSGKVFYDLVNERTERTITDTAIIRIEQLYPFPKEKLEALFKKYAGFRICRWVQEEHSNMGPWEYIRPNLDSILSLRTEYAGRERSASPAAGSYLLHKKQHEMLMKQAFEG